MKMIVAACLAVALVSVTGCNRKEVIPERLEGRVDRDVRYADVKTDPQGYRGKLMLAGGKVLSAERQQDGTKIEVLQIPLSEDLIPTGQDSESKGRFIVIDRTGKISDPAVLQDDKKRITVVGEVMGTTTVRIDESQQQVPQLEAKNVTVWDWDRVRAGYWPTYGYGLPSTWGYRGYYGHPYYW